MSGRKLLFVATEDWFIQSHFLPMLAAAREEGFEPHVAARIGEAAETLRAAGAVLHPLSGERGSFAPHSIAASAQELGALFAREKPDLIHAIGLKPSLLTSFACGSAPDAALLFAITGFGFFAASRQMLHKAMRGAAIGVIASTAIRRRASLLFENPHDRRKFEKRGAPLSRMFIAPGAGVDVTRLTPEPEPALPPFRIGLASRLVKSKGVDVALAALAKLRAEGLEAELVIAGAPDPQNPASYTEADVASWRARKGVVCVGWISDVRPFWASVHAAAIPSMGGEGLPKTLLEAAACGRALVTTDVPGCRDFVRDGETGLLVQPNDPVALAGAFRRLMNDGALRRRLAGAARREAEEEYTTTHVAAVMKDAWRTALARNGAAAPSSANR